MDWKITKIEELPEHISGIKFIRYQLVTFEVNQLPHTLRVSMKDFDAGKTYNMVKAEAEKIIKAYTGSK